MASSSRAAGFLKIEFEFCGITYCWEGNHSWIWFGRSCFFKLFAVKIEGFYICVPLEGYNGPPTAGSRKLDRTCVAHINFAR